MAIPVKSDVAPIEAPRQRIKSNSSKDHYCRIALISREHPTAQKTYN